MNQSSAFCKLHNKPLSFFSLYATEQESGILCKQCSQNQSGMISVNQILETFSKVQPSQNKFVLKLLKNVEKDISAMKSQFFQTMELCWKQFKDEISLIKQKLITPEIINYYTTQTMQQADLENVQQIFKANYEINKNGGFKKTKVYIVQQVNIIKYKFNQIKNIKVKIDNLFNPDYQSNSDQELPEEPIEDAEIQKYIIRDTFEQQRKISTISFNYDNEFVLVAGESLQLTAYQIIENTLIPYQTLIDSKGWQMQVVASQSKNKIYCLYNDKLEIWKYYQNKWLQEYIEQFDQRVHKIARSSTDKLCLTKMKSIEVWNQEKDNSWKKILLPDSHKEIIRSISFNYDSQLLASCCTTHIIVWKLNENDYYVVHQVIQESRVIGIQFSNTEKNMICAILDYGNIQIWLPDQKGIFYLQQQIYRQSCTFGCQIRFYRDDSAFIVGTHSIVIYKQDEDNEWTQQQLIKMNCWNFDVSFNKEYIVADDFNKIILLSY